VACASPQYARITFGPRTQISPSTSFTSQCAAAFPALPSLRMASSLSSTVAIGAVSVQP